MAKQTINIGTGELSGDGESIRSAFNKINNNFTELYTNTGVIGTAPLSSTSTGSTGTISFDSNYFYICTATNSWQRVGWDSTPW